ncbi:MAG: DUF433 domain-containing protein [Armatimonadetes bacterium]|nr:DUF433 domain-containing protein [Armatimonadota bacterium]
MTMSAIAAPPVPLRPGERGVWLVGATRVTLDSIVAAFLDGCEPDEIVTSYPAVPLEQVYSVIAHYLHNRVEVDAYLAERRYEADRLRAEIEANLPAAGALSKLKARRKRLE